MLFTAVGKSLFFVCLPVIFQLWFIRWNKSWGDVFISFSFWEKYSSIYFAFVNKSARAWDRNCEIKDSSAARSLIVLQQLQLMGQLAQYLHFGSTLIVSQWAFLRDRNWSVKAFPSPEWEQSIGPFLPSPFKGITMQAACQRGGRLCCADVWRCGQYWQVQSW